jgi:Domain of unknown function (DUF4136)
MRLVPFVLGLAIVAGSVTAFAETHSDYTKSFKFKHQRRISSDPLADNAIWANDIRDAIRSDLTAHGLVETTGPADFYVAFYVGLRDRYDMRFVDYGMPFYRRGFRTGWWGWPRGYDAWAVPYTESTVIIDVLDTQTNQLVWRGYDTGTLNKSNPDRTLSKAVDVVLARFYHDAKKTATPSRAD